MTVSTEEGDPAAVVASGLRNVRFRINLGSEFSGFVVGSEDAEDRQVMLGLASETRMRLRGVVKRTYVNKHN